MKNKIKNFFSNKRNLSIFLASVCFVLILLLDQLTKFLIIKNVIPEVGSRAKFINGFISLVYVQNMGAAWGIFKNNNIFLIISSFLGVAAIIAFYVFRIKAAKNKCSKLLGVTVGLLVGGAIGNLIDRLAFGYVRDFINFEFISFPVFNFADVALTFGVIMLIIYILFFYSKEGDKNDNLIKNDEKALKNDKKSTKNHENDLNNSVGE